ncbi:MAG: hypothetical protein JRJ47_09895 [Deltaproteobacteria bacterium]|nr:hypothetical protein [Deltaproteobacteria bacterium]
MKRVRYMIIALLVLVAAPVACHSTYDVKHMESEELEREGNIVFVRPTKHTLVGTRALRDYVRVTHKTWRRNTAGLLEVYLGLRDIGGAHFWDLQGPDFPLSIKTAFYDQPYYAGGQTSVPIYETNWQTIKMLRGATTEHKAVCPKKEGAYYQVTISELLF